MTLRLGEKGGGFTSCYNEGDTTGEWIKSRAITSLGGMAATEQVLGMEDIGNSKDMNQAFGIVGNMITSGCVFGFDYKSYEYDTSEDRKKKIEDLAGAMIQRYYKKAKEIIAKNREFFDRMMKAPVRSDNT